MGSAVVRISAQLYDAAINHLLPEDSLNEEAAFMFARAEHRNGWTSLRVVDAVFVDSGGFAYRSPFFLELSDETRASVIKQAHDLGASIIELHSHPSGYPRFSSSDKTGLEEFVPHVRWRLHGRPYAAIVVAPTGCDGVAWLDKSEKPDPVVGISVEDHSVLTSRWSYEHWQEISVEEAV